jgi:hypothetical protein
MALFESILQREAGEDAVEGITLDEIEVSRTLIAALDQHSELSSARQELPAS